MNSTIFSGKWTFLRINPTFLNGCKIRMHTKFNRFSFGAVLLLISLSFCFSGFGQKVDSLKRKDSIPAAKVDSIIKATHSPRKAAIRSAIIPGWGQVYNKKYWKVPIIYAALGITAYIFIDNLHTYQDLKFSYAAKYKASVPPHDSTDYFNIKDQYKPISPESLRAGRDQFRRYVDYTAVFFLVFWGLNVVDAAVDAHLKAFDISPDLSMKIKPAYNPLAKTGGVILVFNFKH
jgi:Family of unknown function (DUF5683)